MKKIVILTVCLLGLMACKKVEKTDTVTAYDGQWSLVSYNPNPIMGSANTSLYNMNDIVWDFNSINMTIAVSVNATVSNNPLSAGMYNYQTGVHTCNYGSNQYLTTGSNIEGVFVLDDLANNKLKITAECLDGAILKFER